MELPAPPDSDDSAVMIMNTCTFGGAQEEIEKGVVIRDAPCRFSGWSPERTMVKLDILRAGGDHECVCFGDGEELRVVIELRVGGVFQEDPTAPSSQSRAATTSTEVREHLQHHNVFSLALRYRRHPHENLAIAAASGHLLHGGGSAALWTRSRKADCREHRGYSRPALTATTGGRTCCPRGPSCHRCKGRAAGPLQPQRSPCRHQRSPHRGAAQRTCAR